MNPPSQQLDIDPILEKAGFKPKESKVYTTLLQKGPLTVLEIARHAELRRPTVYLIVEDLAKKGFISEVPQEKKKRYIALSPERIVEALEHRAKVVRKMLPDLLAFLKIQNDKPDIRFFNSYEGMMNVYREITSNKSIKEVLAFVSPDAVPAEFDAQWDMFVNMFKRHGTKGREIFSVDSITHPYVQQVKQIPNYSARLAPREKEFFSDTIIYGNKVAMFSFEEGFALIVNSKAIAKSITTLFEIAWTTSRSV